ncbi:MAG TPA: GIY-YIG nuclease family protein [Archangium sp.]|nr:GIY-YIG nuclease family protein [Archangium sp.]
MNAISRDEPQDAAEDSAAVSPLRLEHLLRPLGLDLTAYRRGRVKLVRHEDNRCDLRQLYREGRLDLYQSYQSKPVFTDVELLVSFLGRGERQAVFVGVYDVLGEMANRPLQPGEELPTVFDVSTHVYYDLRKRPGFEVLEDRLVIDWGPGTRMWHQWFETRPRPVVELLPEGYVSEFPGYQNVLLSYDELVSMVKYPTANREWHRRLSAVAGVYLILDTRTGKQYVGSASGKEGILGRWKDYAETGHGGNRKLIELVQADGSSLRHLQFCILQTLDRGLTRQEVRDIEYLHMRKLGSRVHGLN